MLLCYVKFCFPGNVLKIYVCMHLLLIVFEIYYLLWLFASTVKFMMLVVTFTVSITLYLISYIISHFNVQEYF